ncbi:uncharacterized protein LOC131888759 [Tigriopus californicus]|uniref:uncharacterized protein LOC131888759 n=1 Tax=Tigriopus californicus TaxID=6832 RepID=UPI0027D9D97C|nr:uncharacterized protein LOC131888759 [Tigriopus californicus]
MASDHHQRVRALVCLICNDKAHFKIARNSKILSAVQDFVIEGYIPEDQRLPNGICTSCRKKLLNFSAGDFKDVLPVLPCYKARLEFRSKRLAENRKCHCQICETHRKSGLFGSRKKLRKRLKGHPNQSGSNKENTNQGSFLCVGCLELIVSSSGHSCVRKHSRKSAANATGLVIRHSTLQQAKLATGISQNQMRTFVQVLRQDSVVEPHLMCEMANENKKFENLFSCDEVIHGTNDAKMPLVYCTNVRALVDAVLQARGQKIEDTKLRLSIDEGRTFLKVSASIFSTKPDNEEKMKMFKSTGVKRTFLLAITPMRETYESIAIILSKLSLDVQLGDLEYFFAQDLKCFNITLGLGPHRSAFPCLYCHWQVGK